MTLVAFTMQLKPGVEAEYERRHDEIWPELSAALTEAGVYDYAIFLEKETGKLFAVQKRTENHSADDLKDQEIVKRWWAYMADLMETHADNAPVSHPLQPVFYHK